MDVSGTRLENQALTRDCVAPNSPTARSSEALAPSFFSSLDIANREERRSVEDVLRKGFNRGRRVGGMHRFKERVEGVPRRIAQRFLTRHG